MFDPQLAMAIRRLDQATFMSNDIAAIGAMRSVLYALGDKTSLPDHMVRDRVMLHVLNAVFNPAVVATLEPKKVTG